MKRAIVPGGALLLALAASASGQITASATLTPSNPVGGVYHYSATLRNTGTTTVGTYWFAWIPGYDFLPSFPSNIASPPGWNYYIEGYPASGYSIQWTAGSGAALMQPGAVLSGFGFDSPDTPATLLTAPAHFPNLHRLSSYVYIAAPELDLGYLFDPALSAVCVANCDNSSLSPVLNVNDFTCFINKFAAGDSYANCDGSSLPPVLNVNDFTCFLNMYAAGCP